MAQYIDKDALLTEIERRMKLRRDGYEKYKSVSDFISVSDSIAWEELEYFKEEFLPTLEVKDVDEIIKNAEDHAYFAGSENAREKLINKACKWWEVELIFPSMTPEEFKLYKSKVRRFRKDMEDET